MCRSTLETLGDFGSHSRIQLHSNDLLSLFQNLGCQVTSTGTDFEDDLGMENGQRSSSLAFTGATHVALLEIGLVNNSIEPS